MGNVKIAINVPEELVSAARKAVSDGKSPSLSAYIAEAMTAQKSRDALDELVEELVWEHGEPSADARNWADSVMAQIMPSVTKTRRSS